MELLLQLWLPVIVSAVAVWIAAAVAWTAMPHHNKDTKQLPDEDALRAALRQLNVPPGSYLFPSAAHADSKNPEFQKKWKEGPTGMLNVWPPNVSMGTCMILSFLVYLTVSVLVAYLGSAALTAGAPFAKVFQVLGTAGVMAYCFASLPGAIWFQASKRSIVTNFIDGLAYGLMTGAIFAWLWPGA